MTADVSVAPSRPIPIARARAYPPAARRTNWRTIEAVNAALNGRRRKSAEMG
jgi:hypothetical protein